MMRAVSSACATLLVCLIELKLWPVKGLCGRQQLFCGAVTVYCPLYRYGSCLYKRLLLELPSPIIPEPCSTTRSEISMPTFHSFWTTCYGDTTTACVQISGVKLSPGINPCHNTNHNRINCCDWIGLRIYRSTCGGRGWHYGAEYGARFRGGHGNY